MKKLLLAIAMLLIATVNLYAQPPGNQWNIWHFGQYGGFTFNTVPPTPLWGGKTYHTRGTSTVSDALGNLLFYNCDTTTTSAVNNPELVMDRTHRVMPNGSGVLNGGGPQTTLIIQNPNPLKTHEYYMVHYKLGRIYYTVVDMSLPGNGGTLVDLGDVPTGKKNQLLYNGARYHMTATRHCNGRDWWILAEKNSGGSGAATEFVVIPLDTAGFGTPVNYTTGFYMPGNYGEGQYKFNCDGSYLFTGTWSGIAVYDFNTCTGEICNEQIIDTSSGSGCMGIEVSSNSKYLYAVQGSICAAIQQYDLSAGTTTAIAASKRAVTSTSLPFFLQLGGTQIEIGPDGRIYTPACILFAPPVGDTNGILIINDPDSSIAWPEYYNLPVNLDSTGMGANISLNGSSHLYVQHNCSGIVPDIGSDGDCTLPVVFSRFDAIPNQKNFYVDLNWTTESENNNFKFEVQRSVDGFSWQPIDEVLGAGNSSEQLKYHSRDDDPHPGKSFYRIKQIDFDGRFDFTSVESVQLGLEAGIRISPVPVHETLHLTLPEHLNGVGVKISMYSLDGKLIFLDNRKGKEILQFDVSEFSTGAYLIRIEDGLGNSYSDKWQKL